MASKSLGTLTIDLVAKIGGLTAGLSKAERQFSKSAGTIESRASKMGKAIGAALAAGFAAVGTALVVGIGNAVDHLDEIGKAAQKIGVGTEELSKLAYAAELADVSFEQLQGGLIKLAKAQDAASQGTGAQLDLFRALGVEFQNADGTLRNTADVFRDLADQFQALPDGATKTTTALTLLGKSGAELIPLMNGGAQAIGEAADELDRFGGVVTPEAAKQAEQYNDNITRLKTAMSGFWQSLAQDVLPTLVKFSEQMVDSAKKGGDLNDILEASKPLLNAFGLTAQAAVDGVQALTASAIGLFNVLNGLSKLNITGLWRGGPGEDFRNAGAAFGLAGDSFAETGQNLNGGAAPLPVFDWEAGERAAAAYAEQSKLVLAADAKEVEVAKAIAAERERAAKAAEAAAAGRAAQSAASREAAKAAREMEQADAALQKRMDELKAAGDEYVLSLDAMEAQLAGPLAEATFDHKQDVAELQKLYDDGAISIDVATRAQMLLAESFAKTKDELDPYGKQYRELLEDMDFEYKLLGMTNAERVAELELRRLGIDMATKEGAAAAERIKARVEEYEAMQQQISAMDDFRASFTDNLASVLDGSKSIKDAIKDMVSDLIAQFARLAAERWASQLFGEQGTGQTGSAGGGLMAIFSAFAARAGGGPVMSGVPYLVGEQGPELVIPNSSGTVIPAGKTAAMMGGTTVINVNGATSRQALSRIAIEQARLQRRSQAEFA